MTRAAIDLGTNTFHLLIAKVEDGRIETIVKERRYVFIGQNGLDTIFENVILRAEAVLREFSSIITAHDIKSVKAVVTESLRSASNRLLVLDRWQKVLGHPIRIISGLEEAGLAGAAVLYGTEGRVKNALAVDIGGGSVELIHIENGAIKSAKSILCGISVLHRKFHAQDPISQNALDEMIDYLKDALLSPLKEMRTKAPLTLVGIAGSFEILPGISPWGSTACRVIDTPEIKKWFESLAKMNEEERKHSNFIPSERAQYIIEALAIIIVLIESGRFALHLICPFSLKEGLLLDH